MSQKSKTFVIPLQEMPTGGSDIALKKEVMPLKNSLKKVLALRPVTWYWKTDKNNEKIKYGFIAQEVEEVIPDLVSKDKWEDGTIRKFLSSSGMTPYIVRAIKEQHEEMMSTHEKVEKLLATLRHQQKEIEQLKNTLRKNSE